MAVTLCYASAVLPTKRTLGDDVLTAYHAAEDVRAFVSNDVPFSFAIHEDVVTLVGHDDETGIPIVLAESESPEARSWLEALFDACLERATPLEHWLGGFTHPDETGQF